MFDRLQKPFLTVDTGEAYQPIRLTYDILDKEKLLHALQELKCIELGTGSTGNWFWRDECNEMHFESISTFKRNPTHAIRLGSVSIKDSKLYINLPSFKRACIAVTFFHKTLGLQQAHLKTADFINKVFGIDERLPHGFSELLKEEDLNRLLQQRLDDYKKVHEQCEHSATAEEAMEILANYSKTEAQKKLPYAERYLFQLDGKKDPEMVFLAFYIFLRGRELVAIKRWLGETECTLIDIAEDTIEEVFGGVGIDLIE